MEPRGAFFTDTARPSFTILAAVHFAGSSCRSNSTRGLIATNACTRTGVPLNRDGSVFNGVLRNRLVRVGVGSGALGGLAADVERAQREFMTAASARAVHAPVKVMMGDSTVSDQSTFDPARVSGYFSSVLRDLQRWESDGISESRNDDLRRTFARFSTRNGDYLLSGHVSAQYHVLLYYKPDARVASAQKELAKIVDQLRPVEGGAAEQADSVVARMLREAGYEGLDEQGIFEALFDDEKLREKISGEIGGDARHRELAGRRQELFGELDSLLLETYQTSCVLIDEARLVTGEEGFVCVFDLERFTGSSREGHFDQSQIPGHILEWTRSSLNDVAEAMRVNREADTEEGLRGRSEPPDLT